ncbi:beta-xylosidase [Luteolibacter sp. LG18]|nr:beta-xylosidase [Luteolibacter sp. LG18]
MIVRIIMVMALVCSVGTLGAWQADNGDGTFTNPPLYADYPDPDVIRVGNEFYMATTTFANSPGLRLLHSRDLVNWEFCSHVMPRLEGRKEYDLNGGNAYRGGVFAPSLRYHKGTFYVAVTPNGSGEKTRIYRAKDPRGPWSVQILDRAAFDPGLFFDDDGKGYIVTSGGWDGTVTLLTLSDDLTKVVSDQKVHFNKGAEGSKLVKRGEWYYLFNAIPGKLALTVSRAKNLKGPWETRPQIDDKTGGHQGAIVDLPDGRDFGFVMIDDRFAGRMTNMSPIFWEDGWPVWGEKEAPGRVPATARKPVQGVPIMQPATSDDFSRTALGLQWAWNHNPDDTRWSLTERPGFLRLKPTKSDGFWTARNTLTQKGQGPWSRGDVKLDLRNLKPGDICGFGTLGKYNGHIAVNCQADGRLFLSMEVIEDTVGESRRAERVSHEAFEGKDLYLRTELDFRGGRARCAYSADGTAWRLLGGDFPATYDWRTGTFQGPQYAIFCYNSSPGPGLLDVDYFRFSDKPE